MKKEIKAWVDVGERGLPMIVFDGSKRLCVYDKKTQDGLIPCVITYELDKHLN